MTKDEFRIKRSEQIIKIYKDACKEDKYKPDSVKYLLFYSNILLDFLLDCEWEILLLKKKK